MLFRSNAPVDPQWNSSATAGHSDGEAVVFQSFDITEYRDALRSGRNVLGIHGLNQGSGSSDFLMEPQLDAVDIFGGFEGEGVRFERATRVKARAWDGAQWSALDEALGDIGNRVGSAAAIALNSASLNTDSALFQARFDTADWSGQLLSYPIGSDGNIGALAWDAGSVLDGQDFDRSDVTVGRAIVAYQFPSIEDVEFGASFGFGDVDSDVLPGGSEIGRAHV